MFLVFALFMFCLCWEQRSSSSPRGHLGLSSTHSPSAGLADSGTAPTPTPLRSLSRPAQATMTPLSVQYRGGGQTRSMSKSAARDSRFALRTLFAATPPATTMDLISGWVCLAQDTAVLVLRQRCSTATLWKDAAMSALSCSLCPISGPRSPGPAEGRPIVLSTAVLTEVLSPAKLKSQFLALSLEFFRGTGKSKAEASPLRASASTAGPPPLDRSSPRSLATLS
mmetsp:Transcript_6555/g.19343  ORF Transcript_6555/g.19343 Transcript_6555/m.19343 type:complete len:225 (+) Transcript_6555:155-829(+)